MNITQSAYSVTETFWILFFTFPSFICFIQALVITLSAYWRHSGYYSSLFFLYILYFRPWTTHSQHTLSLRDSIIMFFFTILSFILFRPWLSHSGHYNPQENRAWNFYKFPAFEPEILEYPRYSNILDVLEC